MQRVVIVGGGFGGISAAKKLAGRFDIDVTLIDRRNYHLFQPLLYQVATAGLTAPDIASPIRSIFSGYENIRVLLGEVTSVDLSAKKVATAFGELSYDYLILACGADSSYYSHPEWQSEAPSLKTLDHAIEIRRRILVAYEEAEKEPNEEKRNELLTFVIVGGGPTGVELAGAISEIARKTLSKDFRAIDPSKSRIILVEGGTRILPSFGNDLVAKAKVHLENMGVEVLTGTQVEEINGNGILAGNLAIRARTVIWAAGVRPAGITATMAVQKDKDGRIVVTDDLSLPTEPKVFVVGDMANAQNLPGLAPVAMQQGRHAAKMIISDLKNEMRKKFIYSDKGQMATIGRKRAIVEIHGWSYNGTFAWLTWLLVHIYYLIGFRNKLFVMLSWAWSYVTFKKGARIIVEHKF
ncbi:MAG: pyridine nucleotide-disulfide oxidoreductase [Proteobacteria bacterium SG_bin7]|nr:MAG: pyridine nucleotide-disulfide oxidoreductase [Proteobacteria bacterium SG_bin7]